MLVVFPSIFVADTNITYGYNFVAPLREKEISFCMSYSCMRIIHLSLNYALTSALLPVAKTQRPDEIECNRTLW